MTSSNVGLAPLMTTLGRSPVKMLVIQEARSFPEGCYLRALSGMKGILSKSSVDLRSSGVTPFVLQYLAVELIVGVVTGEGVLDRLELQLLCLVEGHP